MTSILTNTGAMTALQTLKSINNDLEMTQDMISSGKRVQFASDNAAVWAISKVMEADIASFNTINEGLAVYESTVAVARTAAEQVTGLLTDIKTKLTQAANTPDGQLAEIDADITALKDQLTSVVDAAQFNGINLVNGTGDLTTLFSLDRDAAGVVTRNNVTVTGQDLSVAGYAAAAVFTGTAGVSTAEDAAAFSIDDGATEDLVIVDGALAAGDRISVTIGETTVAYQVTASDIAATTTADVVANALRSQIETIEGFTVDYDAGTVGTLTINNDSGADVTVTAQYRNAGAGGLSGVNAINATSAANVNTSLDAINTLIDTATTAAASFGTDQNQIQTQMDFIGKLEDAMTAGVGSLVDANMEEASAKLQALQVQQQLGIQSLSIANQSPQSILSLFR